MSIVRLFPTKLEDFERSRFRLSPGDIEKFALLRVERKIMPGKRGVKKSIVRVSSKKNARPSPICAKKGFLTDYGRALVVVLRRDGSSLNEIARDLHLHKSSVCRVLAKENQLAATPLGRPKKNLSARRMEVKKLAKKCSSRAEIGEHLRRRDISVSVRTVGRDLESLGMRFYRAGPAPKLTPEKKLARVAWCRKVLRGALPVVIYSDEKYFDACVKRGKYLKKGTPKDMRPKVEKEKFCKNKVMCWGAIGPGFRKLVFTLPGGRINAEKYQNVLKKSFIPFYKRQAKKGKKFVFMQDGASAHTAKSTMLLLKKNNVEVLPWPSDSPDVNCMENMWALTEKQKGKVAGKNLEDVVQKAFDAVPQSVVDSLLNSFKSRLQKVIKAEGAYIQ